ncbi:SAM hydrolase/SAM-dependent halogenase family protein [Halococcus saccharolyticus]|uniref:NAD operon protein n=1 Tax=Halococcus saccharolyticus DSM 5350 TaxID=1227455 RepID=M0MFT8_9EURY|nr:SAM-dependent chlorinase/fluorinase [Halococcus saccharolyticus]EMA43295.1 NAD operon protein [Halococcus saccharolyticus DSM 5350]
MITLTSDFGSPYPAAMKGVLCAHTDARLVDIAHDFPRQDVRTTAFWLREVLPYFPPATHLVVVDPGVGTDRAALAIRAGEHVLVGPDNGVLAPVARQLADRHGGAPDDDESSAGIEPFEIVVDDPESATFHGRDVFAPAAALAHEAGVGHLAACDEFVPTDGYEDLRFPEPAVGSGDATGEILVVDGFGNAITNVPGAVLDGRFGERIDVDGERVPVARSYAHVAAGERLVTVGSHGNVELAANRGRGDETFGVGVGDPIELAFE